MHPIARSYRIWTLGLVGLLCGCPAQPDLKAGPDAALAWKSPSGLNTLAISKLERSEDGRSLRVHWKGQAPKGLVLEVQSRGCCQVGPPTRAPVEASTTKVTGIKTFSGPVTLMGRLLDGKQAWVPAGHHRRIDDAWLALDHVQGQGDAPVPTLHVPRWDGPLPEVDGRLDEGEWNEVAAQTLVQSMGGPAPEDRTTRMKLAWTDQALLVAFEMKDPDVTEKYRRRDDPIYEHEAAELFLMPDPFGWLTGPYVELQASPTGVVFDASFTGPRRGMQVAFDGGQKVASQVQGSLDRPGGDQGWTTEWVVPWEGLAWVEHPPQPGDRWRANAFRIDRSRGRPDSYQAWSPPRVGDFHRVERFGWLVFEP